MRLLFKYIFNFLLFLIFVATAKAQVPVDSLPGQDTLQMQQDSLMQQVPSPHQEDSLMLKQDSIYNSNVGDTTKQVLSDTLQQDTLTNHADTTQDKKKQKPEEKRSLVSDSTISNGFGVFIDYLKFASLLLSDDTKYEGGAEITLSRRFRVVGEAGYGLLQPESAIRNGSYRSEGMYGRTGIDFTILADARTSLYIGGRYAISQFEDEGIYRIESLLWANEENKIPTRENLEASWFEIVLGTEGKLFADLYLGWIFRYRSMLSRDTFELFDVYSVPGFGIVKGNSSLAINFYLKYKFHW
jgi:hypothetical protein